MSNFVKCLNTVINIDKVTEIYFMEKGENGVTKVLVYFGQESSSLYFTDRQLEDFKKCLAYREIKDEKCS